MSKTNKLSKNQEIAPAERPVAQAFSDIATVSTATGLAKDTLRVWERRYGFPQPERDANGERVYPDEQVEKLRVIRRLMDRGLRPGNIVGMPLPELKARFDDGGESAPDPARDPAAASGAPVRDDSSRLDEVIAMLRAHRVEDMMANLNQWLMRVGLQRFILDVVSPLNVMVGEAWMQGRLQIFEEHLYTEQMKQLLRNALGNFPASGQSPRVLLTTLPGEQHQLGLLMAQAFIAAEGAQCVSLGTETPAWDIEQATRAHRIDVVALSFSSAMPARMARAVLENLRVRLDPEVAIWAGGSIWQRTRKGVPGVTTIAALTDIAAAVAAWRAGQLSSPRGVASTAPAQPASTS